MDAEPVKKKGGKKGKGKKGKVVVTPKIEEEEVDMSTPYRGKPSKFFVMNPMATAPEQPEANNPMNLEMNPEQWNFVFKHYPEYGSAPYDMMTWLYGMALQNE